jgi:transmembrane sensor
MSANSERVRILIAEEAAGWFVANRVGLTGRERNTFAAWLKASPVHVEEYLAISVIARDLPEACRDSEASLDALLDRARNADETSPQFPWPRVLRKPNPLISHAWQGALAIAVSGILIVGALTLRTLGPIAHAPTHEDPTVWRFVTRHGEQQTQELADHSVLHLNTDSAVSVRYTKTERLIALTSGEVLFEVAHEPKRPFRVQTGSVDIVDLGTKFDVRLRQHATEVTVLEGRVAAGPASMSPGHKPGSNQTLPADFVTLAAGQQISIAADRWPAAPIPVDAERTTAWLHRQIRFEHEPLDRVADEFNRYAPKPIEIVTPALQHLEISGVFATDDTEAFIAFLRSLEGVHVEVTAVRIRVSQD